MIRDIKFVVFGAIAALLGGTVGLSSISCIHGPQKPTTVVQMTVPVCMQLAMTYNRPDIAKLCQTASDIAPLLDKLLGESRAAKCVESDAGTK